MSFFRTLEVHLYTWDSFLLSEKEVDLLFSVSLEGGWKFVYRLKIFRKE